MTAALSPVEAGGHFLFGMGPEFARDPLGCLDRLSRLGDVVRLRFGPFPAYQFNRPEHIGQLLSDHRTFGKQMVTYGRMRGVLGNGLITSDGDFWLKQRRIAQPAFHRERITGFATIMVRATEGLLARWQIPASRGESVDVAKDMTALTLQIVCETLLGVDAQDETRVLGAAFRDINETLMQRLSALVPLPLWVPTAQNRRFRRALTLLDGAVYRIIARRHKEGDRVGERSDLLSMLMEARDDEDGQRMSDRQLRDEVLTILFAGHETTAVALSWALHLLGEHPEAEAALRAELAEVLGGRQPTVLDLERLIYTRIVIDEAMRIYPPVWLVGRGTNHDANVGGYRVPKGAQVIFSPWVVHRSETLWVDPTAFRPERFARGASVPKHAYFPFISGARQCIGNGFALMEAQLILAMLIQRCRFRPVPGHPVEPEPLLTLRPRHGVRMRIAPA